MEEISHGKLITSLLLLLFLEEIFFIFSQSLACSSSSQGAQLATVGPMKMDTLCEGFHKIQGLEHRAAFLI